MILSAPIAALRPGFGDEQSIRLMARAGFDAVDYTFNLMCDPACVWNTEEFERYAARLRRTAEDSGIFFNQAHAPFLFQWGTAGELERYILPTLERSFACAALLGIPHIVVHPIHHLRYKGNEAHLWEMNLAYYRRLLPAARRYGVKLALENMLQPDERRGCIVRDMLASPKEYRDFYDALADDGIIACVDVGHSGPTGEDPVQLLRTLGHERVKALHIHDNCFRNDDHLLPFMGQIDWEAVTQALADIDYTGDFTFEVTNFLRYFFQEDLIGAALKLEHDVGRHLIAQIEAKKWSRVPHAESTNTRKELPTECRNG